MTLALELFSEVASLSDRARQDAPAIPETNSSVKLRAKTTTDVV